MYLCRIDNSSSQQLHVVSNVGFEPFVKTQVLINSALLTKRVFRKEISFFINLVHEIRTPLSLIRLPLEKLLEDKREGRDAKYLSVIDRNVNYLLGITNQLLDFQKMENGGVQLSLKKCDINQLVSDVHSQFTSPAELKGISVMLDLPEGEIFASVDREKVCKIIVNLIGNAVKYAQSRIDIKLVSSDEGFRVSVSDDGPGIPDVEKRKVFEAFYQVKDGKSGAVGTGIGLAFSKSLAEAHHGTLSLEDSVYGGSSFVLTLPWGEEAVSEEPEVVIPDGREAADEEQGTELSGSKFTILLVEDNVDLLNLTRESLSTWFKVLKAQNGRQALEVLANETVDVIVSDVMMPEMNGLELTAKVKSDIEYSHIPVILLTAKTTLEAKVEGFECGADVYIEKPFSIRQLRKQIENLLKLRQAFHKMMAELSGGNGASPISPVEYSVSQKDCELMAKVRAAVEAQLSDENFSVDTLAESLNMSRSNFYRKIKALAGMPPNDYLKTIRLNKAAELLKSGVRITEVCEKIGFSSSSYFAKCFKIQFGVLPKDYH